MVKYSPKENTYKEVYLINKFEKDIMDTSLKNLQSDKKIVTQKITPTDNETQETQKEVLQDDGKKKSQTFQLDINSDVDESEILTIPEAINNTLNNNSNPENSSSLNNNSISDKRIDSRISQGGFSLTLLVYEKSQIPKKEQLKRLKRYLEMKKGENRLETQKYQNPE